MATNYEKIAREHRREYGEGNRHLRIYKRLYSDKTHFVYELIQNAEDADSKTLSLTLREDGLLVWNDGRPFNENDVRSISSIGLSEKDLTKIGAFGIGFKSVYAYTDIPEIYSGDERFRIRRFVEPEGISEDEVSDEVKKLVEQGKTVFRLPFKKELQIEDIKALKERLRKLHDWTLLFLRNLETIQWSDECDGEEGIYLCSRRPSERIPNAWEVELLAEINHSEQPLKTFLVFRKEVQPPPEVIDELLQQAEDDDERKRIECSRNKVQPIEVAFGLNEEGYILRLERCVLFSYLPTEKETGLGFLIHARFQTTIARDNVPIDSPWNKWLVQEIAQFLPEVFKHLKEAGLMTPSFFDVLPLPEDGVPEMLKPVMDAIAKALQEGDFIPTEAGDHAHPKQVFYPHAEDLRKLLTDQDLVELTEVEGAKWLHRDIRDTKEFRRRFEVVRNAGVREVTARQLISWLANKGANWLQKKEDDWLKALYLYLARQKSEQDRMKTLPLVRLEDGRQVSAAQELTFLPPATDEDLQELAPFLQELPIVKATLLKGEDSNEVKAFLEAIGVKHLNHSEVIRKCLLPKYQKASKPSPQENYMHLRYLKQVMDKVPAGEKSELCKEISQTPLLLARKGVNGREIFYVKPCEAYLPQDYTGDPDLETYFSPCPEVWFVDKDYLKPGDRAREWNKFLKEIGCSSLPRLRDVQILKSEVGWSCFREELDKRGLKHESSTRDESIKDRDLDGLEQALSKIVNSKDKTVAQALWRLLLKLLPSNEWERTSLFRGTYHWFYRTQWSKGFDASFYRQLKETAWLPDENGNFRKPAELFAPTPENRKVLGDSVAYLHPEFDITDEPENKLARWLAQQLGINLTANTESVLNYLRSISGGNDVNVEMVTPIYEFLYQRRARVEQAFQQEALIFTPNPPHWWRAQEVFWEDESAVFGEHRGYLKSYYPETLKPFFISVGVSERAAPLDYVRAIRDIAAEGKISDEIRERLRIIYWRLWSVMQVGDEWQNSEEWRNTRDGRSWLGRKGEELGFFRLQEMVWNDHDYLAKLFKSQSIIPFWEFDDLTDLAKQLGIKPISQARMNFKPIGNREDLNEWSEKLRSLANDIQCFLESPQWSGQRWDGVSPSILNRLSVCLVEKARVTFSINGVSVEEHKPRSSYLDAEKATIYLTSDVEEQDYPDLIGDALQDHFGVPELREFVKDLLTKEKKKVLMIWQRRGLKIESVEGGMPEGQAETAEHKGVEQTEEEKQEGKPIDEKPELPPPTQRETREIKEKGTSEKAEQHGGITSRHDSQGTRTRFGGGGEESEKHRKLKEKLAANPSLLGEGLSLKGEEWEFPSGDKVDILLEDKDGHPVTVEIEVEFPVDPPYRYRGVWQAVKYKHLAAVKWGLACEQVRSILVAPSIPNDVKKMCQDLGIEPREVSLT